MLDSDVINPGSTFVKVFFNLLENILMCSFFSADRVTRVVRRTGSVGMEPVSASLAGTESKLP
jgi:hypothetical protein